jgi:hypothetical protein
MQVFIISGQKQINEMAAVNNSYFSGLQPAISATIASNGRLRVFLNRSKPVRLHIQAGIILISQ